CVGLAWNTKGTSWIERMMGGEKTVWRGGFQISYDSAFNNLLSNIAGSSPNTLGGTVTSLSTGRGSAGFSALFAGILPTPPTALSSPSNLLLCRLSHPSPESWD